MTLSELSQPFNNLSPDFFPSIILLLSPHHEYPLITIIALLTIVSDTEVGATILLLHTVDLQLRPLRRKYLTLLNTTLEIMMKALQLMKSTL